MPSKFLLTFIPHSRCTVYGKPITANAYNMGTHFPGYALTNDAVVHTAEYRFRKVELMTWQQRLSYPKKILHPEWDGGLINRLNSLTA